MTLNYLWAAFFLIAVVVALLRLLMGDFTAMPALTEALFNMAKTAFEISLGLTGAMAFWLGIMRVAEAAGLIDKLARAVTPFFRRLFPEIPDGHPAMAAILMNFSANMLGLDNAASPLGLKAMHHLQELNREKDTATNGMIMFLAINTAGLTIIPASVMALRAQAGAANPADIFLPCLLGTSISAFAAIIITGLRQRLNLLNPVVLGVLAVYCLFLTTVVIGVRQLSEATLTLVSSNASAAVLMGIITAFILAGLLRRQNVYANFVEGAKEGFQVAISVIPYLVAMLVGIGLFRACGALDMITSGVAQLVGIFGLDTGFVPALPTAFMKPFSGSGARGLMVETMKNFGADSFAGRLAATLQGSTETTFYTIALYYGAINVKRVRYTATVGLLVDVIGIIAGIMLGYLFFGQA